MKTHFTTYDVVCMTAELQRLVDMRVNQIYDIDNKTYLIRLTRGEEKVVLLLESGARFHTTAFEWVKNVAPSSFTIKLRKHLKNKRLEKLEQLGVDRVIDMQFGMGEAAYHVILELYDRGNIVLTDCDMTILNVLRPHTEGEEIRLAVREKYPLHRVKQYNGPPNIESLQTLIDNSKPGDRLGSILTNYLDCGPTMIKHVLIKYELDGCKIPGKIESEFENEDQGKKSKKRKNKKENNDSVRDFDKTSDLPLLFNAVSDVDTLIKKAKLGKSNGYLIQKRELKPVTKENEEEYFYSNIEFHPLMFSQNEGRPFKELDSFDMSVDEFFSNQEGQKIDLKAMQQEREALKKLSNVKKDHAKRLDDLTKNQKIDQKRAELITRNQQLVDNAILAIRSALANQMSWPDIHELVKAAQANKDPVASCIKQLKLEKNHISIYLTDPYETQSNDDEVPKKDKKCDDDDEDDDDDDDDKILPMTVDVDLGLSAYANARFCHDQRRNAAKKEQKTIESSHRAMKSAEKKTQQALKEVKTMTTIQKARKTYWFEKFYWFISSENYLVISGRDQQQNELIVKRYMRATDIYVHADIQGASSVVIRNPSGLEIPPKTLLEAGAMAISYSIAWDAKIVTSAYWVKSDQVSKTAPTGEYLGTGSFMIRGKKSFLPPCHLVLGLSFLFKLEDSSIERHKGERRVRNFDDDDDDGIDVRLSEVLTIENEKLDTVKEEEGEQEIDLDGVSDSEDETKQTEDEIKNEDDENVKDENVSDDDDEIGGFPDTHVKIEHDTGKITVKTDPKIERLNSEISEENTIYLGDDKPYIIQAQPPRKKQQQTKQKQKQQDEISKKLDEDKSEKNDTMSQAKRGQKGKIKKMKEKYKDQDEDERKLRMDILKSSGGGKSVKKNKKSLELEQKAKKEEVKKRFLANAAAKLQNQENDDGEDVVAAAADVDMLDSLTGLPHEEDELLFAIPVVAPYQTLQNYKFKVKLTPGTGKRGRAAKMAVQIFLKDKTCSGREKDLIKNVKEDMLARNIPGKVKLSAPQLQKVYR